MLYITIITVLKTEIESYVKLIVKWNLLLFEVYYRKWNLCEIEMDLCRAECNVKSIDERCYVASLHDVTVYGSLLLLSQNFALLLKLSRQVFFINL